MNKTHLHHQNPLTVHNSQAILSLSLASRAQLRVQRASPVHPCVIPTSPERFQASPCHVAPFFLHSGEHSGLSLPTLVKPQEVNPQLHC